MSCESVRECLQENLEGTRHPLELAARLPDWAQRHLEGCPACREASWQLVSLECSLRRLNEMSPMPVDLTAGVMAALRRPEPVVAASRERFWMRAAAVLLVSLCLYASTYVSFPPLQAGWQLVSGWSLPRLELPGLSESLALVGAAVCLVGAAALNWRWSGAH